MIRSELFFSQVVIIVQISHFIQRARVKHHASKAIPKSKNISNNGKWQATNQNVMNQKKMKELTNVQQGPECMLLYNHGICIVKYYLD